MTAAWEALGMILVCGLLFVIVEWLIDCGGARKILEWLRRSNEQKNTPP